MDMGMDQMMMARMHEQNYRYDMQLAQHFQGISNTFTEMGNSEYQMYLHHSGQTQGMKKQVSPSTITYPMKPGMGMKTSSAMPGMGTKTSSAMPGMGMKTSSGLPGMGMKTSSAMPSM